MSDEAIPINCQACKLYNGCEHPMRLAVDYSGGEPDLYVVTDRIGMGETDWLATPQGRWMRSQLQQSGAKYLIDGALRCATNIKVNVRHYTHCREFLLDNLKRAQPKVIWCLGFEAARSVLGTHLTWAQIMNVGVLRGPNDIPVVVTDHPEKTTSDLQEQYRNAWLLVARILRDGWKWYQVEVEVYDQFEEALSHVEAIRQQTDIFATDTEFGLQPAVSLPHPTTTLLCIGVAYHRFEVGDYRQVVFDCAGWDRKQLGFLTTELYRKSTVNSVFAKIDTQVIWHTTGYQFYGAAGARRIFDLGQIRWCLDQESRGNGLEPMARQYLGAPPWKYTMDDLLAGLKASKQGPPDGLENWDYRHLHHFHRDQLLHYQGVDVHWGARLWWEVFGDPDKEFRELRPEFSSWSYERLRQATKFICALEQQGLYIDRPRLQQYHDQLENQLRFYFDWLNSHPIPNHLRAKQLLNGDFNPASPKQMTNVCEVLGVKTKMTTEKTKQPKVDSKELIRQSGGSVDAKIERTKTQQFWLAIQKWRKLEKKVTSFVRPFLHYDINGRCHTMFKMVKIAEAQYGTDSVQEGGVDTMRNSSASPCITNMIKDPEFLRCFPAPGPEWECYSADEASIEPRVIAYNAGCEAWMQIFDLKTKEPDNPEADLYCVNWARFENYRGKKWIKPGDVSKEDRNKGSKPLVLGCMYEATPIGIHTRENVPLEICEQFVDMFWSEFKELLVYNAEARRKIFEGEPLVSSSGNRAFFKLLGSYDYDHETMQHLPLYKLQQALDMGEMDAHILRKASNHMTQATSKQILDVVAIRLQEEVEERKIAWCKFTNTVHDSIWGYNLREKREEHYWMFRKHMTNALVLPSYGITFDAVPIERVKLDVEIEYGPTYGTMEKVTFAPSATSRLLGIL